MKIGAVFPQTEIEADPQAIRRWVEGVSELGYEHVLVYDHVTGVDPAVHDDWSSTARRGGATSARPYDVSDRFHEAMVLLGFLSGICTLGLVTGVVVLPQRQTALVAKQAAEVDVLSEGRLRMGVGIGWNSIEFRSMGKEFADRGRRIEEQIELLRMLWTQPVVRFRGSHEWADGVGLAPLPVQRPIPLWLGAGSHPRALARVGELADGWLPVSVDPFELGESWGRIGAAAERAGRDPGSLGIHGRLEGVSPGDPEAVRERFAGWEELGATHVAVNVMRQGLSGADEHVSALARIAEAIPVGRGSARS